jgi:UDP-glucose 4-epimerase
MRVTSAKRILYASGSGVYGDLGTLEIEEDQGALLPISTYGASKLAGEALIASYTFMFGLSGCAFRFGNVVGPRQTHGVGFDFARRLLKSPSELSILGDGSQRKSYVHVSDIIRAVLTAHEKTPTRYQVYNVGTGDEITVTEIAELAVECVGLGRGSVRFAYTGGDRGWKGDVPVVRLRTERIRGLGWAPRHDSRQALESAMRAMIPEMKAGRM